MMGVSQEKLAPIVISVYTRLDHFKKCILSLQENELSCESELFIYSDAASSSIDIEGVDKVRNFSKNIKGFKKITLIKREKNYGGIQNAVKGQKEVTERYGKSIFVEDDNVVSLNFLHFMNDSLFFHKDNLLIHSVSGFNVPNISSDSEIVLSKLFSGWGVGMWDHKDPFSQVESMREPYKDMIKNKLESKVKLYHPTLYKNLKTVDIEKIRLNDVIYTYLLIKHDLFQIRPTQTLVKNIGLDGSGVRCSADSRFSSPRLSDKKLKTNILPEYSWKFDKEIYDFFYPVFGRGHRIRKLFLKIHKKFGLRSD
jgi:hypothetical protein